jgi:hypothetical protein
VSVAVWSAASLLTTVSVAPTFTSRLSGMNLKSLIDRARAQRLVHPRVRALLASAALTAAHRGQFSTGARGSVFNRP